MFDAAFSDIGGLPSAIFRCQHLIHIFGEGHRF